MTVTIPMTGPRGPRRQEPDEGQGQGYAGAGSPAGSSGPQGSPVLRLVPPRRVHAAALRLTPDQQAAVDVVQGSGPVLVPGAPGTGKTTVLVEAAVQRVVRDGVDPERILILAPTRLAADFLRDRFTARLDRSLSTTPARTWASYAFDLIRRAKAEGVIPLPRPPRLLSGPEQDLIIKELLEGHRIPGLELPWPADLDGALETRGFRQEVRQLFDRIIESGRTAGDLVRLADDCGRPDWKAAAALYAEYRDVLDLRMPEAFDPAGIITAARQIFQDAPEFLAAERARLQVVLVDDIQEANPAIFELLADIAAGRDCYITSSPDTVVQGFRGARPDLVAELPRLLSAQAPVLERPLWHAHGLAPAVANAWMNVAGRISQRAGGQLARRLEPPARSGQPDPGDSPGNVEAHLVPTPVHELRYVAQRILDQHINHNRDLADIAVIVRNGGQVSELQRYLSGQGIPVQVPVAESAVRDEVAVRPLLDAFAIALDPGLLTPEAAVSLLTSRIGGATSIELRRLRQSLRREELLGGGGRASDVLLVEALLEPGALGALGIEGRAARRTARMIQAGRDAAGLPGANAESVLWALWSSTGLSTAWTATALAGGPHGARADRDLDAMMALFHTAERYVDQMPGAGPEQFLEYLLNQELPMDTLAARAQLDDAVELMTPASAAGRQWPVVIIAGLQEGVWPNTRLRGELLGSTLYADAVEHGPEYALQRDPLSRLRDIRYDELRSFSTAVSRARELLVCTAVSSEDDQPSSFLDFVAPLEPGEEGRVFTRVERPMTLRALVAELRQHAQLVGDAAHFGDGAGNLKDGTPQAEEAARVLAHLASVEPPVPGAHPGTWWGLAPLTSAEAVVPPGGTVSVSPSKVETVQKSPLDWFVQAAGGEPATDFARSLGTLVHAIAQDMPDASGSEYASELVRRWPALGMKDNWEGKLDFQRAEAMVRKLAQYVLTMRSESRSLLGVEQDFEVALGEVTVDEAAPREALLRGQVDRLEIDGEGRLVVVDLKTGKRQPGKDELSRHPQLGAYQAAVLAGGFDADAGGARSSSGGAVLAQLGTSAVNPAIQQQEPLDPRENWALDMVTEAAAVMGGSEFTARHDPAKGSHGGHGCRLPEVCPLCVRGRQVTE